jgi:hypothetical protein
MERLSPGTRDLNFRAPEAGIAHRKHPNVHAGTFAENGE